MIITDTMTIETILDDLAHEYGEDFNWHMIPFSDKFFVNELKKELETNDPFLSNGVYAVAKCDSNDDVLFVSGDKTGTKEIWRIYHLTYSHNKSSGFPVYQEFDSRKATAEYIQNQFIEEYL